MSKSLEAIGGKSSFEARPANAPAEPLAVQEARAVDTMMSAFNSVSKATAKLDAANAEVGELEENLAKDLAQLSATLDTGQLQTYADSYRAEPEHQAKYDEAREAAEALADTLKEELPEAVEAGAVRTVDSVTAGHYLDGAVEGAAEALDTFARHSPEGDEALSVKLAELGETLATTSGPLIETGALALEHYAAAGGRFGELAEKTAHAFGLASKVLGPVAGVLDIAANGERIAAGDARAEHYVGAAAGIVEIGIGVAAVAGVTVSAPVSIAVGAIAVGATVVSGNRDEQERVDHMRERLEGLGYSAAASEGMVGALPQTVGALRQAGYSTGDVQALAETAPSLLASHPSIAEAFSEATQRLGLTPSAAVDMLRDLGPAAEEAAMTLVMAQGQLQPPSREELIAGLRPANPMFASDASMALADWLAAH